MSINPISVSATGFVDLTRDPNDVTLRKTAVVEDAVWIRIDNGDPDDAATGTGYFNAFLRLQKSNGEKGYNSNLNNVLYDELKSFTDAELLSVVPFVEYDGKWYREFQLDINENDDYLVLNRLQIWVTEHENLIGSTSVGGVHTFTENQTVKVYDTGDNVIMLSYRGGSGNREYKVLVPADDFPEMTYVVIYTEMGFPDAAIPNTFGDLYSSNDGFEEWGVKVVAEVPPSIDVVKTALVTSVPEPGAWVTYKVDIANSSGMTDPVTINSLTDAIEGGTAYSISGLIFDDVGLLNPTTFPFTIQPGMTKTVYFKAHVTGEPRTVNDIVTASGVDDEGTSVSDFDDADVVITDVLPEIEVVKVADPLEMDEPGGLFTYTYRIYNKSVEPVWLTKVEDDILGVLYEWVSGDKIWIAVGEYYDLPGTFTKTYTDAGEYPNIVDAWAKDNEGNSAHDDDDAMVEVIDVLPEIEVVKVADPLEMDEPGGLFTYTYRIYNKSVEPVWLTKVEDDILGVLYEWVSGDKIWIAVGEYHDLEGTFTKTYTDAGEYPNIVDAWAKDNEGNSAHDDDDAMVEVIDVLPVIELVKTADPLSRFEPGGLFAYTYRIYNKSVEPVMLTKVVDDILGTLYEWGTGDPEIWIPVDGSYLLPGVFTETYTDAGMYPNVGEAWAKDNEDNTAYDDDEAKVEVVDVEPIIEVVKVADPLEMDEPGGEFTYTYRIYNHSVEPVWLTKVEDDILGVLYLWEIGDPKIWIDVEEYYDLEGPFTWTYTDAGEYPNIVDAYAEDNEGNEAHDDDDAMVKVIDVLPEIELVKTADPLSRYEPGGLFTYTFTIYNHSVEPVWLTEVVDDKLGTLYEWVSGMPKIWIPVDGSYLLPGTFTKEYTEAGEYTNIAIAYAEDNEGNSVDDDDSRKVTVIDVLPEISITKSANKSVIPYSGEDVIFTFVITNHSVEDVVIYSIDDTVFGDLLPEALVAFGDDPITIAAGQQFTFTITRWVTGEAGGEHYNVVTACGMDNEENTDCDDDDERIRLYWYGFTPGYWKNHAEEWDRTDYDPMDSVRLIFGITNPEVLTLGMLDLNKDGKEDTLMDALNYKGGNDLKGKVQILLRAAVAGLLNESALGDYYPPYDDVNEFIMAVNAAINSSNKGTINTLASQIDYWNNGIHEFPE
jgi:hypothetical protein